MKEIENKKQLIKNLDTIEQYLQSDSEDIYGAMAKLIANGKVFVAYLVDGQYHFAPSRFVGYKDNSLVDHRANRTKHGWDTNREISRVLDQSNHFNDEMEKCYLAYCEQLDVRPSNNHRSYWLLEEDLANEFTSYFTEGARKLITHEVRERNQKVVKEAKRLFQKSHDGELFCEICGFNFKTVYGKIGDGFIEAHHVVSLSTTSGEHEIKPSDFIMVCPNCHKILHRGNVSIKNLRSKFKKRP